MFDTPDERPYDGGMPPQRITRRQRQVLEFIEQHMLDKGYPPSVREIGEAVGLTSPSTVHSHLNTLQRLGFLRRDPTKPRAIEVRWDPNSGAVMERRKVRHVPLVGDVAAGTDVLAQENVEELYPLPVDFTGDGELFMLRGPRRVDDRGRHPQRRLCRRRAARHRQQRRHRRRRHPGRRGDDQVLQARRTDRHPHAREPRRWNRWCSTPTTCRSTAASSPSCASSDGTDGTKLDRSVRFRPIDCDDPSDAEAFGDELDPIVGLDDGDAHEVVARRAVELAGAARSPRPRRRAARRTPSRRRPGTTGRSRRPAARSSVPVQAPRISAIRARRRR